jgi:hypothetical protein
VKEDFRGRGQQIMTASRSERGVLGSVVVVNTIFPNRGHLAGSLARPKGTLVSTTPAKCCTYSV